jgi:hypothetical protein
MCTSFFCCGVPDYMVTLTPTVVSSVLSALFGKERIQLTGLHKKATGVQSLMLPSFIRAELSTVYPLDVKHLQATKTCLPGTVHTRGRQAPNHEIPLKVPTPTSDCSLDS